MHQLFISFLSIFIFSMTFACTPPAPQKETVTPKAAPQEKTAQPPAPEAQKPTPAVIPEGAIALSGDITFIGRKLVGSHDFVFKTWSGHAQLKDNKIDGGNLVFQIETASVVADPNARSKWTPKLEKHIKDPDFFDVAQFPTANFASTSISADAKGAANTYTISGKLTIKGIAKDITFPAVITLENGKASASATVTLNRQDFGISYPGKPDNLIQDNVVITIKAKG
jgi:polyisoprenoid-binding protein YceI